VTVVVAKLQATSDGITATVVGLPASDLDPAAGKLRVYVNGVLTIRDFDPTMEQP